MAAAESDASEGSTPNDALDGSDASEGTSPNDALDGSDASAASTPDDPVGPTTTRAASLFVALAVAAGVATLATGAGVRARGPALGGVAGVLLGVAVLLRTRDTPASRAVSSLLVPVTAVAGAGALVLAAFDTGTPGALAVSLSAATVSGALHALVPALGVTVGSSVAAFGATATVGDGLGTGGVRAVFGVTAVVTTLVGLVVAALVALRANALAAVPALPSLPLDAALAPALSPTAPVAVLLGAGVLLALAAVTASGALTLVPLVHVASRRIRPRVAAAVAAARRALRWVALLGVALAVGGPLLAASGELAALPGVDVLLAFAAAPPVRAFLIGVTAVSGVVVLVMLAVRRAAGSAAAFAGAAAVTAVGALAAVAGALLAVPAVDRLPSALPPVWRPLVRSVIEAVSPVAVALAGVEAALLALSGFLLLLLVAGAFRYVPRRAAGGALVAAGLVTGAVAVGVAGGPALPVFAAIGCAVVAWDVGEHGVSVRTELGARAGGRLTVLHAVGSIAVGLLGVGVAVLARDGLLGVLGINTTPVGAAAVAVGVLVVLTVTRG